MGKVEGLKPVDSLDSTRQKLDNDKPGPIRSNVVVNCAPFRSEFVSSHPDSKGSNLESWKVSWKLMEWLGGIQLVEADSWTVSPKS